MRRELATRFPSGFWHLATGISILPGMPVLFLATGNAHKIDEVRSILGTEFLVLSQRDTSVRFDVPETADTFEGNAELKALVWAAYLRTDTCNLGAEWVLADDSGLEVDALGGAPGVQSARFAALDTGAPGNSPDAANNAKLLRLMANVPDAQRTARFRCVLALVPVATPRPDAVQYFSGACPGRIQRESAGVGGFGYDPLFVPDGYPHSFAELGAEVKNQLSHRAQALAQLKDWFRTEASAGSTRNGGVPAGRILPLPPMPSSGGTSSASPKLQRSALVDS